jgi:hypothetical protein
LFVGDNADTILELQEKQTTLSVASELWLGASQAISLQLRVLRGGLQIIFLM